MLFRSYPANFKEAVWIVPLLAIAAMMNIFDNIASSLLIARSKPRVYAPEAARHPGVKDSSAKLARRLLKDVTSFKR